LNDGINSIGGTKMPLFMDIHEKVEGANAAAVAAAHKKDLEVQSKYGVRYQRYWLDESAGRIYCLVEAPDKDSAIRVHREAHGLVPDDIHQVVEGE
jgi:Nickel responsive protein SCO4226-like